jgi:hypothetical protein
MPPQMLIILKKLSVNWFSKNKEINMMGMSVIKGAKAIGKLWYRPLLIVSEMINVWNGPGVAAAVRPSAAPCRKIVIE